MEEARVALVTPARLEMAETPETTVLAVMVELLVEQAIPELRETPETLEPEAVAAGGVAAETTTSLALRLRALR